MNINNLQYANEWWVLALPLFLMFTDMVTGYLSAWKLHNVESGKMRSGLVKKSGELIEIMLMEVLGHAIGVPSEVVQWISVYICLTEGISIVENLNKMDVPMPESITRHLKDEIQKIEQKAD